MEQKPKEQIDWEAKERLEKPFQKPKWHEEFDAEFPNSRGIFEDGDPYDSRRNSIKDFIASLLQRQKEEIGKLLTEYQIENTPMSDDEMGKIIKKIQDLEV